MSEIETILAEVAAELCWLEPAPVFIGGATIGLFLDEFGRSQMRSTKDVDCIIPAVATLRAWNELEGQLRSRGWSPDPTGPICRYISPKTHIVDLLAIRPEAQGFAGTWFVSAVESAVEQTVAGRRIRVPDVAHLLACKLEAFKDRGARNPLESVDFEDIVAILDGCARIEATLAHAPPRLQDYLRAELRGIFESPDLRYVATRHLPRGGDEVGRQRRLLARLDVISAGR